MSFVSDVMDKARATAKKAAATPSSTPPSTPPSTPTIDGEIGLFDLRNKLRNPTSAPPTTPPPTSTKCGVICQKKKKRKVLLIGFGVLLVGGISYFILKKK